MGFKDLFRRPDPQRQENPAPARRRREAGRCPGCDAPASKRIESCGFGSVRSELCGVCGHDFGERHVQ